ncbi:A24 family peptidase [Mycolicibacterium sp. 3033]|nr:A24 family peptidase [Mycolicibacterium aurantiacum]
MGSTGGVLVALTLSAWLITLSAFDIRQRRLPNVLTLPGAAIVLAGAAVAGYGRGATLGAAALFAAYAAVHLIAPAAMGAGDVKLAIGVGASTGALGPDVWALAALLAAALTMGWAAVLLATRSDATVPHGVSMCVSAAAVLWLVLP